MFHYPHGMAIDKDGNIWVADGVANPTQGGGPRPQGEPRAAPPARYIGNTVRKFSPDGKLLLTIGKPGVIGKVGTLLGDNGINIAGMHVGREQSGGRAIMVLLIDEPIGDSLMQQIRAIPGMETAQPVTL